jgi:hypothetical protein
MRGLFLDQGDMPLDAPPQLAASHAHRAATPPPLKPNKKGWTYLQAYEASQKYKEGKYILEKARVVKQDAAAW